MQTKAEFRTRARELRRQHANECPVSFLSEVLNLPCYALASSVAAFLPFGVEPQTSDIIEQCYLLGKRVGVPAWKSETNEYELCSYPRDSVLIPSRLGILEPLDKAWTATTDYDLILIPGLLFDRSGTRLGHGKGYYDRMLAERSPTCTLVALAFDWQILDETLPQDLHDVPMDFLVTPNAVIPCNR